MLGGAVVAARKQDQLARLGRPDVELLGPLGGDLVVARARGSGAAACEPISSTASRRSCSASHARAAPARRPGRRASRARRREPAQQVVRAGGADRDRPRDRLRGRGGLDGHEAAHARAADADAAASTPSSAARKRAILPTSASASGTHRVLRLAVSALVVGERRPAARGAGPAEVAVVLLSRPGAVDDHHPRPGRRRLRQPEQVGPARVHAHVGGPRNASAHRLARYSRRRPLTPQRQVLSGGESRRPDPGKRR